MKGLFGFAQTAAIGAGEVLAGKIIARKVRGLAGQKPGTMLGSIMEAGIGLGAGLLVSRLVNRDAGERVAMGGLLAPMETLVQQLGIPHVSDSLGDDGYELTGDLGYIVADDDDDGDKLSDEDDLAGYVGAGDGLGGYVETEYDEEAA